MPFPWTRDSGELKRPQPSPACGPETAGIVEGCQISCKPSKQQKTVRSMGEDPNNFPWVSQLVPPCRPFECIQFKAPRYGVSAGRVLEHAHGVLTSLFAKQDPCIFKIGITHNPCWRWSNTMYGYRNARDRWTNMVVIYVAEEPFSPSMLEAALIDQYRSDLDHCFFKCTCVFFILPSLFSFYLYKSLVNSYRQNWHLCRPGRIDQLMIC